MNRRERKAIFEDTISRLDKNHPSITKTVVYDYRRMKNMLTIAPDENPSYNLRIMNMGTVEAAQVLFSEGKTNICMQNFASAKNPGGGVVNGSNAQEECICRSTGLFPCLKPLPIYNVSKRDTKSCLYQDFAIYSPSVPVIKNWKGEMFEKSFEASVITCAAPNAGEATKRGVSRDIINFTMDKRIRAVLNIAQLNGERNLILGAFGCGVFQNDLEFVANSYKKNLQERNFDTVVFALLGKGNLETFKRVFA